MTDEKWEPMWPDAWDGLPDEDDDLPEYVGPQPSGDHDQVQDDE